MNDLIESAMFEIAGQDIANLGDADLRALVSKLAQAEIRAQGGALSAVTAGGNQDAPDGGLDVRVECLSALPSPDYVPRPVTGFQVKKPDMPPSAIRDEMRPQGELRDAIRQLADASGAYIIVCSQGSVADKPLLDRRDAMREALHDLPNAAQLHTDFYDRERLAAWVNEYPGITAWVRGLAGRPVVGWSGVGDWDGDNKGKPYLINDSTCLIDESRNKAEQLTISDGIARLRATLREPHHCVRLVGLSGLGKTRLVRALFEPEVGKDSLDASISVYTDYSVETNFSARDMARYLRARGQRAILIVDNCNPDTHSQLAKLCSEKASQVSLLTVEYDVRDDEPEHTDVFRLQSASPDLVTEWLKREFPELSQVNGGKIAELSDGNFRIARAIAETVGKDESLGRLKSRDLFQRIFQQRNSPNPQLLHDAEDLSLLYSVEGEDAH